jgi:hypothetical protein
MIEEMTCRFWPKQLSRGHSVNLSSSTGSRTEHPRRRHNHKREEPAPPSHYEEKGHPSPWVANHYRVELQILGSICYSSKYTLIPIRRNQPDGWRHHTGNLPSWDLFAWIWTQTVRVDTASGAGSKSEVGTSKTCQWWALQSPPGLGKESL